MTEETQKPEVQAEETPQAEETQKHDEAAGKLAEALKGFEGGPGQGTIEEWKQKYGEIFCSGFSEEELFVWRPIGRTEFSNMQIAVSQSQDPIDVEAEIVRLCTLWTSPKGQSSLSQKAGSLTTLHEQIMQNSNFMDPRVAAALVIKL